MATSSDSQLIHEIRAGRVEAWRRLVERYQGRLHAMVAARLGNADEADDVVQETFIGLVRSLPHYDPNQDLETYLFAIARHKLVDVLRTRGRRAESVLTDSWDADDAPGPGRQASSVARSREGHRLDERVLGQALRAMVAEWVSKGQWDRLEGAELVFVADWPNTRAARHLGRSAQWVADLKRSAVARLRREVRDHAGGHR